MISKNIRDLSQFGVIELKETARLLDAYNENINILNDGVAVEFNPSSGNVFLVDDDYNVAMMNGNTLEKWYNCGYCGHEGFKEDMNHTPADKDCEEFLIELGVFDWFIDSITKEKPQEVKNWLSEHGFNKNEVLKSLDNDDLKQMYEDLQ